MEDGGPHTPPVPQASTCTSTTLNSATCTSSTTTCTAYSHSTKSTSTCTTIKLVTFQPQFAGKPDEDAEAHLRMNDWMDTHAFQECVKVQCFCLTLGEEGRLWYESLRLINIDWIGLQNQFRQQYSKIGNTREQLFHAWRSFHSMRMHNHLISMSHA